MKDPAHIHLTLKSLQGIKEIIPVQITCTKIIVSEMDEIGKVIVVHDRRGKLEIKNTK